MYALIIFICAWISIFIAALYACSIYLEYPRSLKNRDRVHGFRFWALSSYPFVISYKGESSAVDDAIMWAINYWNSQTGVSLFSTDPKSTGTIVPVLNSSSKACSKLVNAIFTLDKNIHVAIFVDSSKLEQVPIGLRRRFMAHELGHVLQLDHDSHELSIMHPTIIDGEPVVTARDRAWFRGLIQLK